MAFLRYLTKFAIHLLIYLIIAGLIMAFSVLIFKFGPGEFTYYDDSWDDSVPYVPVTNKTYNVLLDQHSHTDYSDGRVTVRQNIEWHVALGFTAVAITDHNTLENSEEIKQLAEEYQDEIIVLQGMEWTTSRIHLNFIGISEWNLDIPYAPTDVEIQEAISEVHRQNGTVTANHLPFTKNIADEKMPSRGELLDWGVDFLEVVNELYYDAVSYEFYLKHNESIGVITGTDFHSPDPDEGGRVHSWTTLNVENFSKEAVMNELRAHNTSFIMNQYGIVNQGVHKDSRSYSLLKPFYELGEGLVYVHLRYDRAFALSERIVVSVFVIYSFGFFILTEIAIFLRKKIKLRRDRKYRYK
ncbi:MAG: CehA/McbA family metallohydrolase [Candidatus Heimdallarchaeota archaeon]|nr:CehA/McbA family metallohydrolase [Candidatus Heimdallarchaeota archaeon]MCK4878899.1 CehA/McbA family metallohydrolase [Candidatus Heimdallarchaeota archaeon]